LELCYKQLNITPEAMIMENLKQVNNGAEAFVESLNELGVEHLFFNPGGDSTHIQGAIAKYKALGKKTPKVILFPHESVAVAAAHGHAMVSGKPQVVLVFGHVGTFQGGGPIVNMTFGRIPVILCASQWATYNRLNWLQEPCDPRSITRDYVKWDHEFHVNENINSVLQEAFRVASTEPCGPVYLSLTGKVLKGKAGELDVTAPMKSDKTSEIDMGALRTAADMLIASENPLIMTAYSGRHHQTVASLVELAETLGVRVITTDRMMNFPSTHPLCSGIDGGKGGNVDRYIAEADVLLLIDYDFPAHVEKIAPGAGTKIIHIDIEPLKRGKPIWGRPVDILIEGDSSKVLPAFNEAIRQRLTAKGDMRSRDRFGRLESEHRKLRNDWHAKAMNEANQRPISAEWLSCCINETIDEDAILVQMAPSITAAMVRQIPRTKPGTLYGWGNKMDTGGSMGWSLGAALGAKLAAPEKMVVSLVGDGGFIYGCPIAALWTASAYNVPFLTIVCNNQGYGATRESLLKYYGESSISGEMGFEVGAEFKMPPDYTAIAKACHAYGRTVEAPDELLSAVKDAVDQVRGGRPAVLNVKQQ
jgi:acetolactate synthase-1/2/3 large subunit